MQIRLSKRQLRRGLRWLGGLVLIGLGLWLPYWVGQHVTPPATTRRPALYSPTVRHTETYRRQAQRWLRALETLDADLVGVLADTGTADVYHRATRAQGLLSRTGRVSEQIALQYPPVSLVSLRDSLQLTSDHYLTAALLLNAWVGEPTPELYQEALEAVRVARTLHAQTASNPWLSAAMAPATALPEAAPGVPLTPPTPPAVTPTPGSGGWADE